VNEFELIARFFAPRERRRCIRRRRRCGAARPSTGCELAVSVDMLVAGRHFYPTSIRKPSATKRSR
jgi:thiamine monophosphate kinase